MNTVLQPAVVAAATASLTCATTATLARHSMEAAELELTQTRTTAAAVRVTNPRNTITQHPVAELGPPATATALPRTPLQLASRYLLACVASAGAPCTLQNLQQVR